MDETSQKILDYVKDVGKTSGGKVQEALGLSEGAYKRGKDALKEAGLVLTGRGRGGTIWAIEGAVPPPEPKKLSKEETAEIAREARAYKNKITKLRDEIEQEALRLAQKSFPDADAIDVDIIYPLDDKHVYIYPWYDGLAITYERYL